MQRHHYHPWRSANAWIFRYLVTGKLANVKLKSLKAVFLKKSQKTEMTKKVSFEMTVNTLGEKF